MIQDFNNIQISTFELAQMYSYIQDVRSGYIEDEDGVLEEMERMYNELPEAYPNMIVEPTFEEHLENLMNAFYLVITKRRLN